MIPISDDNPTLHAPWMTWVILAALAGTWILLQGAGLNDGQLAASICNLGMVPAELLHTRPLGYQVPIGSGLACVIDNRSEEHTSELQSPYVISYPVFCLKKK